MNIGQGIILQKHPEVYPYLITRVGPTLYHIIILPKGQQTELAEIARTQTFFNKLESCLVLGAKEGVYLSPDGLEVRSSRCPRWRNSYS